MKLSIATLFVLLLGASADFDIYQDDEYKDITQSGFLVFADGEQASCDEVAAAPFFKNRSDVSGKKKGVRQAMSPDVRNNTVRESLASSSLTPSSPASLHSTLPIIKLQGDYVLIPLDLTYAHPGHRHPHRKQARDALQQQPAVPLDHLPRPRVQDGNQ
jgi:hypothetical protein